MPDLITADCFRGLDLRDQLSWIYEVLRIDSGDEELPTRECVLGEDWNDMLSNIFDALSASIGSAPIAMDMVVNFSSGTGGLTAAKLNSGTCT